MNIWVLTLSEMLVAGLPQPRVTAFNRNVEELGKRTADLAESRSKSWLFFSAGARWRIRGP